MNITMILLTVSVGCNLWFLFLLLYDRIMETRFVRFLKGIAGLWRSLGGTEVKQEMIRETPPAETSDIIGAYCTLIEDYQGICDAQIVGDYGTEVVVRLSNGIEMATHRDEVIVFD